MTSSMHDSVLYPDCLINCTFATNANVHHVLHYTEHTVPVH